MIEIATGETLGTFDSEADVALCHVFEKLARDQVEVLCDASPMSPYASRTCAGGGTAGSSRCAADPPPTAINPRRTRPARTGEEPSMTACIPEDPAYCSCPLTVTDGEPTQIRILIEDLAFAIPTALVALSLADRFAACDRLNRALASTAIPGPRSPCAACAQAPPGRPAAPCTDARLTSPPSFPLGPRPNLDVPYPFASRIASAPPKQSVPSGPSSHR